MRPIFPALLIVVLLAVMFVGDKSFVSKPDPAMPDQIVKSDAEWQKILTPEQFKVLRKHGTEPPFTSLLHASHERGIYRCAACDFDLFSSETKFDSGTGWPSFYAPVAKEKVGTQIDRGYLMTRTEVHCARCGGHLGHLFDDGPNPTGLRYCINAVSLKFEKVERGE